MRWGCLGGSCKDVCCPATWAALKERGKIQTNLSGEEEASNMARQGATNHFKLNEEMGGDDSRRHVLPNQWGQKPPRLRRASSFFCHTCLCSLGRQSWNLQITIKSNQFQSERCRQGFQSELGLKGSHETQCIMPLFLEDVAFFKKSPAKEFCYGAKDLAIRSGRGSVGLWVPLGAEATKTMSGVELTMMHTPFILDQTLSVF